MFRLSQWLLILAVVMTAAGCQQTVSTDYYKLDLADVSGTVMLDGNPVPDAHIKFEAPDKTYSFAKTDANGNYTLRFDVVKEGILPGPKTVSIRKSGAFGAEGGLMGEGEGGADEEEGGELDEGEEASAAAPAVSGELHSNYHKNSQLTVTVESGSQTINWDLKSDGSTKNPS